MAQDIYAPLEGKHVTIDKLTGAFRACMSCGGTAATVSTAPVGMHQGHLTCTACGRLTSYLSRDHLAAMLAAHDADERRAG
ncbi:hypothetical protein [Sagittula sp. S175]|uniref:hypothetical protein n=1 Tax=Sagittula sp. S175 TaxID=3415129 RepID=UPI003C7B1CA0